MDHVFVQGVALNQQDFAGCVSGLGADDPVFVGAYCVAKWVDRQFWDDLRKAVESAPIPSALAMADGRSGGMLRQLRLDDLRRARRYLLGAV